MSHEPLASSCVGHSDSSHGPVPSSETCVLEHVKYVFKCTTIKHFIIQICESAYDLKAVAFSGLLVDVNLYVNYYL